MEGISDYEFNSKDLIGHGAFAIVYRGRHKQKPGLTVAIKSITKKNIAKSQNLLSKEIKILKELTELHHENVVALLDCKETQTHVYLVMEYCNGGDLADYLHSKGTLSEDTIRLFLKQLAGAMKALFGKGIVHRDLKPQNILLSNGGKTNPAPQHITLKIADFGFARFLQDGVMAATLCGSPMYMAPEVIMSLQYDAKADLWSLGTIVFQCLAGKAPFQANTPQALKQYYEKNANLAPRIPSGTSPELTDLLLGLLKRNARDRMEFETFFNHPFIRTVTGTTNTTPSHTQPQQQQVVSSATAAAVGGGAVANPRTNPLPVPNPRPAPTQPTTKHIRGGNYNYTDNLPPPSPPPGHLPPTPEELRMSVDQKSDTVVPPSPLPTTRPSPVPRPMSAADDTEDFVMVPASIPMEADGPRGGSCPRGSGKVVVGGGAIYQKGHHHHYTAHTPQVQASPRPSNLPVQGQSGGVLGSSNSTSSSESYRSGEPIPVPSQRATYQQMTGSSCSSDNNLPSSGAPESPQRICQGVGMGGGAPSNPHHQSPGSNPPALHSSPSPPLRSQPIAVRRVSDTRAPDVASLSPPSVQFTIGTPPLSSRRRSTSGSSYSTTPPTGKGQMIAGGRMTPTSHNSPLRQSGRNTPPHLPPAVYAAVLPPILGSPTKHSAVVVGQGEYDNSAGDICGNLPLAVGTCPQHLTSNSPPFTTGPPNRAITLPEMTSSAARDLYSGQGTDMSVEGGGALQRSRTESYLLDSLLRGGTTVGGSPPNPGHLLQYGQSAPAFLFPGALRGGSDFLLGSGGSGGEGGETGAITFYAPPLHQETLMEKEHNETLAKLNFVLALVDCILELARSRATPITALRESTYRTNRDSAGDNAILPIPSEAQRRAEQLVLYVRALQLLSSALSLAKEEKNKGRLQPSTAVKTVVGVLNERFRQALTVCKDLNSSGAVTAVDPKTSTVTADKLIYNYAIDMCQSAALDELFGKPEECFRRYQTAQILLHSLAQQVAHESDRTLLTRYKQAVEKRLYLLHEQGLVQMVSTDTA